MSEKFRGRQESSPEIIEMERKIGGIIDEALESGYSIKVAPIEEGVASLIESEEEVHSRYPDFRVRQLVYTDGLQKENKWEEEDDGGKANVFYKSRKIEIDGATLIVERSDIEENKGSKDERKFSEYHISAKSPDAVNELIKSKELPELDGKAFVFSEETLGKEVLDDEFEVLRGEIPIELQEEIRDALEAGDRVEIHHLNAPSIRMEEVDNVSGTGRYPSFYKKGVVFTDGELKRGKTKIERGEGSNPDGHSDSTTVTIRNAKVVAVSERTEDNDREGIDEQTTLVLYADDPEKYAKFSNESKTKKD